MPYFADPKTAPAYLTPADGSSRARRCRTSNTYPSKAVAVKRCFEFVRRIVDGKARKKGDTSPSD